METQTHTSASVETHNDDGPMAYIACLSAYNSGFLHGAWIAMTQDVDEIWTEINAMLASSPVPDAEEWAIHDFSGFAGLHLSESEDIERVHGLACAIEEHGDAYALYVDMQGLEYSDPDSFQDAYHGEWGSEEDFAYDLWEQCGYLSDIPEHARCYIDFERVAHDLFISDYLSARDSSGNLHVFARY